MSGYGAKSGAASGVTPGYGSPTPTTAGVVPGYGSPSVPAPNILSVVSVSGRFGDDGGDLVEVMAEWPGVGPYRFRLVDATGSYYPDDGPAHSTFPDQGGDCYTLTGGLDVIVFALPPAPPGLYDLQILYGEDFSNEHVEPSCITVYTRTRRPAVYALRRGISSEYHRKGPVAPRTETLLP